MPVPPYPDVNLRRATVQVGYEEDPLYRGERKTLETIVLPDGYVWTKTGTRTRKRRVKNRDTLFDGSGYLIMSYFGEMIEKV